MSEKFDEEEISGDFEREYVRLTWLARYFDGDESQLVQRLGRVLRKDPNKTWPLICIPVSIGTFEDPLLDGNQTLPYSPLNIIIENASKVAIVDAKNEEEVKTVFDIYDGESSE